MKALVYHGPGQRAWEDVPDPTIESPTDAIVAHRRRRRSAAPTSTFSRATCRPVKPGTILGHEAVGIVTEIGDAVTTFERGDRVLVSCITSCGRCRFCKEGHYGLCTGGGGWIFGHLINGLQAEYARVPFADTSVYKVPEELTRRAGALPRRHPADGLRGRRPERPRRAGRHDRDRRRRAHRARRGPDGEAATRRHTSSRSTSTTTGSRSAREFGADVTINNGDGDRARTGHGVDRRPRRGRRDRSGRRPGHVRALHRADPPGWQGRQRRRPRPFSDASSRDALDPRRDDHDGARRHVLDPEAAEADRGRTARRHIVRHASLPARETMAAYDTFADAAKTHALKVVLEADPVGHELMKKEEVAIGV